MAIYVAPPLVAGYPSRKWLIAGMGEDWFQDRFLHYLTPVTLSALLVIFCLETRNWFEHEPAAEPSRPAASPCRGRDGITAFTPYRGGRGCHLRNIKPFCELDLDLFVNLAKFKNTMRPKMVHERYKQRFSASESGRAVGTNLESGPNLPVRATPLGAVDGSQDASDMRGSMVFYRPGVKCVTDFFDCIESVMACNFKRQQELLN